MRNWIYGTIITVAILLTLECCSRSIITLRDDLKVTPVPALAADFIPSADLAWERRPGYKGKIGVGIDSFYREFDSQEYLTIDSAQVADQNIPKIIAVGDSTVFGWGLPAESTFCELLERSLPGFAVINLGVNGYTSFQGYKCLLRYGPLLRPSLIIAAFSFNDRRYVLRNEVDSESKFRRFAAGAQPDSLGEILEKIYLARILRAGMRRAGLLRIQDAQEQDDVRKLDARVGPQNYAANLRLMAEYARQKNIPLIFLVLPDNPLYTQLLYKGLDQIGKSDYDGAIRTLSTVAGTNSTFEDLARKYLAQILEKQGKAEAANQTAILKRPADGIGGGPIIYPDREYHAIMLGIAQDCGAKIVDARSALAEGELFLDMVHFDAEGHRKVAFLLHQAAVDALPAARLGQGGTSR